MAHTDPHSARVEAEKLIATALAVARKGGYGPGLAAGIGALGPIGDAIAGVLGHGASGSKASGGTAEHESAHADRPRFATGDPECCVCPICRTIVALRDPSPEFAERLATGAGDFAAGVASLMRALSSPSASSGDDTDHPHDQGVPEAVRRGLGRPDHEESAVRRPASGGDDVWRSATRTRDDVAPARADSDVHAEGDVWAAATADDRPSPARPVTDRPAKPMARKAVKRAVPPAPRGGAEPGDGA